DVGVGKLELVHTARMPAGPAELELSRVLVGGDGYDLYGIDPWDRQILGDLVAPGLEEGEVEELIHHRHDLLPSDRATRQRGRQGRCRRGRVRGPGSDVAVIQVVEGTFRLRLHPVEAREGSRNRRVP